MKLQRDIDLIDELRTQQVEAPWLEFKSNLSDEAKIGKLISALSNAARLEGKDQAFLVWGIEDGTHIVKGTSFDPFSKKSRQSGIRIVASAKAEPRSSIGISISRAPRRRNRLVGNPCRNHDADKF
ncbi:MAG: putative DNA binding domain-containing protein [Roseovarius sp.]|nr:putative DNA binding domain-containing protein [Roseovarius sp.]